VTIAKIDRQDVSLENDPEELKYILFFQEAIDGDHKGLVMNWTNIQLCARATGTDETDEWLGKQIELYDDPNVSFGGKLTGGIRIRPASQRQAEVKKGTDGMKAAIESENPAAGIDPDFNDKVNF